jgi:hypothetical protein
VSNHDHGLTHPENGGRRLSFGWRASQLALTLDSQSPRFSLLREIRDIFAQIDEAGD